MNQSSLVIATADAMLQRWLVTTLQDDRYRTMIVASESAVFDIADPPAADLLILDEQLSATPTAAICQRLRWRSSIPILVLAAPHGDRRREPELPPGANAIMRMPCDPTAIRSQVASLLATRRAQRSPATPVQIQLGAAAIDLTARAMMRDGNLVRLSRTEWSILETLLAQPNELVSVRALLHTVWGADYQAERAYVHVYINRLRRKLEDDPTAPRYLLTEPGIGYRIMVPSPDATPAAPTPPRSVPAQAHRPPPPQSLIGREHDLQTVIALVTRGEPSLITLTGPGGTGKTALALHVAAQVQHAFVDGVVLIDAVGLSDGALVLRTIAQRLEIDLPPERTPVAALAAALHDARLLLVLDTFEQVHGGAEALAALLAAIPTLTVLVTSRRALGIPHELVHELQPLRVPPRDPLPPLAELSSYPAIELFLARAREVAPSLELSAETAPSIAELCIRLDGLPLALELAAARLRWFTPAALLQRLVQQPLTVLTSGHPARPTRHLTLRAMLEWSVLLLRPEQQKLFARLAVFLPGGSAAAAEVVCATVGGVTIAVLDHLDALLALHLIERALDHAGAPCWRMHATIREYAAELLHASGEAPVIQQQHASYYAALAATTAPTLAERTPADWIAQMEHEHDNLRTALAWSLASGAQALALQLGGGLWRFWIHQGYLHDGQAALAAALASAAGAAPRQRWPVVYGLATLLWAQGDQRRAIALYEESLALSQAIGDAAGVAWSHLGLGWSLLQQDDRQAALQFEASLALCRDHGDRRGTAWSLIGVGSAALRQAQHERAFQACTEGLALCRAAGDPEEIALALTALADVCQEQGLIDQAQEHYLEGLAHSRARRTPRGIAWATCGLGWLAISCGDSAQASAYFNDSVVVAERIGDQRIANLARAGLGWAALLSGAYAEAEAIWQANVVTASGSADIEARLWNMLGQGYHALFLGAGERATELCSEALKLAGAHSHVRGTLLARNGLAWIALLSGDSAAARTIWQTNLAASQQSSYPWGQAQAELGLGLAALTAGDSAAARQHYGALLAPAFQRADPSLGISALEGLAAIAVFSGDMQHAARWYGAAAAQRVALLRPMPPAFVSPQAALIEMARQATPPELWHTAWEAGSRAALETLLAEARAWAATPQAALR